MYRIKKGLISILAIITCISILAPASAYAKETIVSIDNHTSAATDTTKTISGITISGVTAPQVGMSLDSTAVVTTAEKETWEIPVLWVDSDNNLSTKCVDEKQYFPALTFYLPQGLAIEGDTFEAALSEDLVKVSGYKEILSVYDSQTGITYILPANLRDYFYKEQENKSENSEGRTDGGGSWEISPAKTTPNSKEDQNLVTAVKILKYRVSVLEAKNLKVANVRSKAQKGRKALITWKKNKQSTGYKICCSTNKNFKKEVKKITVRKASTNKIRLKGLKAGRTYYVKVRTVKRIKNTVTGKAKTVCGKWSTIRMFRAKK